MSIFSKFRETVRRHGLIGAGDHVLLAYSGGADSTALLVLLLELQKKMPFQLSLAHFNHRLRENAVKDEEFALGMAGKFTLPLYAGSEDVGAYARENKLSVEEAGRLLRYEFLKKTAAKIGAGKIATAHTMTDQAETFLMRLLRGSGPRGLGGIFPVVEGKIIRPLIGIERPEIERFLGRKKMPFRTDESNRDRRYLRNKIRLGLIPYLKKNLAAGVVPILARTAAILREEDDFIEKAAVREEKGVFRGLQPLPSVRKASGKSIRNFRENDFSAGRESAAASAGKAGRTGMMTAFSYEDKPALDAKVLFRLHPALARRVVRNYLAIHKGDLRRISFKDIETVLNLAEGKEFTVKKGLVLRREGGLIVRVIDETGDGGISSTSSSRQVRPKLDHVYLWDGAGELDISGAGWRFKAELISKKKAAAVPFDDNIRVIVDADKIKFPFLVRRRAEGDRYQPIGSPGRKKLKDIFRERRIPIAERNAWPVFFSGDEIVWVPGCPVGEAFKVRAETRRILVVEKKTVDS
jgi:tRNA(Ile)-lysidine synthase